MARDNHAQKVLSAGECLDAFRLELERQEKPPHTVRAYVGDVRAFLKHYSEAGGIHFPAGVRPADVRAFLAALRKAGAKPSTQHRRRAGLSSFFILALAKHWCAESPVVGQKLPPVEAPLRRALSPQDLRRYLGTVRVHGTPRDLAVCELLAATAIREDELVRLQLEDVTLSERRGAVTVQGKGMRQRTVPLHRDVRRVLAAWLAVRPNLGSHLFPGRAGAQLHTSTVRRIVDRYERLSGVSGVTPHVFRHTVATDLVRRKKKDLALVQRLLGHKTPATTSVYLAPNLQDLEDAVASLVDDD